MASVVISDVGHHFHQAMFGANTHQQESSAVPVHHRATPLRTLSHQHQQDGTPSNASHRNSIPSDVHMADAQPQPVSASQGLDHRIQGQGNFQGDGTTPRAESGRRSMQPLASPAAPTSQQTPTAAASNQYPQGLPSGAPSARSPSHGPLRSPTTPVPRKIKVKSLAHIQSFALDESSAYSIARSLARRPGRDPSDVGPQYDISEMPVTDIIEMVAGLLAKITTTNDRQHEHLHRQIPPPEGTKNLPSDTASVLAFHGKNVPSISILSYLSRIHKYCPTTYEVFLSLLVYFDRMTERVNAGPLQNLRHASSQHSASVPAGERQPTTHDGSRHSSVSSAHLMTGKSSPANQQDPSAAQAATPPPSGSLGTAPEPVRPEDGRHPPSPPSHADPPAEVDPYSLSHFFVVDSFNIHRLVIAGVTCASKFFSDVFYTNSRYAKVGGLPLIELNHLELQFLILNDFRLAIPLEEMEAYGTMLVEFYAREVVAQQQASSRAAGPNPHGGSTSRVAT